jgi:predicted DNA-binding protein
MKIGRQIAITAYRKPEQQMALNRLSKKLNRPMRQFLREGLDHVLKKSERKGG